MNKENDSKSKLLKVIFGFIAAGIGAVVAYKAIKKEEKKIIEAEEASNKEIQDLGASPEKIKEEVIEHEEESERNFVKALYAVVTSPDSGIDENYFDLDRICSDDDEDEKEGKKEMKVLHVMEDVMSGNRCLKLLIEIPEYTNNRGNYNKLRITDIIYACKDSGKYVMAQILKKSVNEDPAWSKMVAVIEYSYAIKNSDTRKIQLLEIPNRVLKKIYDDDNSENKNMAVRIYEDWSDPQKLAKIQEKAGNDFDQIIQRDALRKAEAEGDEIILDSIEGSQVELMYSLGFKEEELFGYQKDNCLMTLTQAYEIIEYYLNNFSIKRTGKKVIPGSPVPVDEVLDEFSIGGAMFHAPNKNGRFDSMARFYDTDERGRIFIDSFKEEEENPKEPKPMEKATPEQLSDLAQHFGCRR